MSVSRFEARKLLVIEEANAIGTAALRTGLLAEPFAERSAALLREYTAGRLRWGNAARTASVEREQERKTRADTRRCSRSPSPRARRSANSSTLSTSRR